MKAGKSEKYNQQIAQKDIFHTEAQRHRVSVSVSLCLCVRLVLKEQTFKYCYKYSICDNLRNLLIELKCYFSEFPGENIWFGIILRG